jgi:hypothetical protein
MVRVHGIYSHNWALCDMQQNGESTEVTNFENRMSN